MANGFKDIEGFNVLGYAAKAPAGNDSNNGLTKDTPKATFFNNYLIGSGFYSVGSLSQQNLRPDGKVIIDVQGGVLHNDAGLNIANLEIRNAVLGGTNRSADGLGYVNCILKNISGGVVGGLGRHMRITQCKLINGGNLFKAASGDLYIDASIIINKILRPNIFSDGYIDFNSTIECFLLPPANFRRNNINGTLLFSGYPDSGVRRYAIQDQLIGTPQDNGYLIGVNWLTEAQLTADGYTGTISGWNTAIATCINRDPKFNNASFEDFSLQADSPHIGKGLNGSNIGGTEIANTALVSQNGVGTIKVIPSPEIDTSNPNFWVVKEGFVEGTIEIIRRIGTQKLTLLRIEPIGTFEFDSDIEGGQIGNRNVLDSTPNSSNYPRKIITTSLASNNITLPVIGHNILVGELVRVLGEDRFVDSVTADLITVDAPFRAPVPAGTEFQVGQLNQLAALRPNRLTCELAVSTQEAEPTSAAEWDNDIDPIYAFAGQFSTQEYFEKPVYIIDGLNVFGGGDAEANTAIEPDEIAATWVYEKHYVRNNYGS